MSPRGRHTHPLDGGSGGAAGHDRVEPRPAAPGSRRRESGRVTRLAAAAWIHTDAERSLSSPWPAASAKQWLNIGVESGGGGGEGNASPALPKKNQGDAPEPIMFQYLFS